MKLEDGKVVPCRTCYKTRQAARDIAAKLIGTDVVARKVTTSGGWVFTVDETTHRITASTYPEMGGYVGTLVYLTAYRIVDVERAANLPVGRIADVEKLTEH